MNTFTIAHSDQAIHHLCLADNRLRILIEKIGPIQCSVHNNGFDFVVNQIIGQMLSNKVADVLSNRLYTLCNGVFSPDSLLALDSVKMREIGLSQAKSSYIINFANIIKSGELDLESLTELDDEVVMKTLTSVRGIGSWTAKMYLLFVLQRPDVLPWEDGAFKQSFRWLYQTTDDSRTSIENRCFSWHPYSSYAARYLYRALDMGLTKTLEV